MAFLPDVPGAFFGIDMIEAAVTGLIVSDLIEDEEFRFRSPIGRIADLRALKIFLRLLRDEPWIAFVGLARNRIEHVTDKTQRGHGTEGVERSRIRIRHHQQITVVDRLPATDR